MKNIKLPNEFKDLSIAEIKAIDQIYFGQRPTSLPKTLNKLVEKGFIVTHKVNLGGDYLGPIQIIEYDFPIYLHYIWCKYRASQLTSKELEEFEKEMDS